MLHLKNAIYIGSNKRASLFDLEIPEDYNGNLIIFIHGYMGFKDWGAWNLMEKAFTEQGFGFCKFNLTHNGGTSTNGIDFPDLKSFANNTYSKEKQDVTFLLNEIQKHIPKNTFIHLMGHSRGGGIALLNHHDERVKSIITLAAISSVAKRFSDETMLKNWKETGVRYVQNQRTKQEMPHNYIQYLDFVEFKNELNIEKACKSLEKPNLVIHGDKDVSVAIEEGVEIATWTNSPLYTIEDADHVFGSSHPWNSTELPEKIEEIVTLVSTFILKQNQNKPISENEALMFQLTVMSKVDGEIKEIEFGFLLQIAQQLGLTKEELIEIYEKKISITPPKNEIERIVQFYRLCLLMFVDNELHHEELKALRNSAIRMGLQPLATEQVIAWLKQHPGKSIPTNELLRIFQINFN
jgi:pimeloyl-ACP methyl ester carboxylesterase